MLKLLKTHFGYDSFRPLQKEIIDTVLSGQDTLVLMPTGGGKSLCFQLPALALPGLALVISPLIALMKDQVDTLCANGISAALINSSITPKEQAQVMQRASAGDLKILYLAPERLGSYGFSEFLDSLNVSLIAIDEAHCISEWGHDFRPEYRNLWHLRKKLSKAPVIALTATATPRVRRDILSQLGMEQASVFVSSFNRANLHYSVRPKYQAFDQLVELLQSHKDESIIVYCFSRKNTEETAKKLTQAGLPALPYHAGLNKDVRQQTQERFIRDEVPIIVATIAFGMGIDKPDVRLVVHLDLPKTIESYYQETGRTGRDGLPGECILFYSYADRRKHEFFINQIEEPDERAQAMRKLEDMIIYCQTPACRRFCLLTYFGEDHQATTCDACDNCLNPPVEYVDATEISQKILSAVLRTGERFGMAHVCDVLRGSKKKRVIELGHHQLSVFGIAKNLPIPALREYIEGLKKLSYLQQNLGEYPTLQVTIKGKQALIKNESILLPPLTVIKKVLTRPSGTTLEYNLETFEKLRALRKQIADQQNVPPFVIFGDKTLHEMAYYLPSTLEAFSHLFGVGKQKLEAFGQQFIDCIAIQTAEQNLKEKPVPRKASLSITNSPPQTSSTLNETKELLEQKLSIKEIAKQRGLSPGTIIQHLEKLLQADELPDITHLKPKDKDFQKIQKAFNKSKNKTLTAIFKQLDEEYSYDELRLARIFL
ncbi:DNA helicase RecQ [Patescibacteria group bacterium]|nr:DNA helicase RecQ [Patescibacteria group bacterium]